MAKRKCPVCGEEIVVYGSARYGTVYHKECWERAEKVKGFKNTVTAVAVGLLMLLALIGVVTVIRLLGGG